MDTDKNRMRNKLLNGSSALFLIGFWLLVGCASPLPAVPQGAIRITGNPQYDSRMANRIAKEWHAVLNTSALDYNTGTVKVSFVLYADGSVSDIHITGNTAGIVPGYVSAETILKCVPFPKWSPEMVKTLGRNHCDADFTFNYQGSE
jgi:hypothetical protein